jgi:hypothetical protein
MTEVPPMHVSDQVEAAAIAFEDELARRRAAISISDDEVPPPSDLDSPERVHRSNPADPRPVIVLSPDQAAVTDAAIAALSQRGGIYVRGLKLVHVIRDRGSSDWLRRPDGSPMIVRIERDHLLDLLSRSAIWISHRPLKDGGFKEIEVAPPAWIAPRILSRGAWQLPQLESISDAPVFRADGSIHAEPGYDEQTRVIFDPCGVEFPPVPAEPTHAQSTQAFADLLEPFSEFPFVADTDRAAVGALILSVLGRSAIDGCVPMFVAAAPTPGSGKGLLVNAVAMIATGRVAPLMAPTEEDEETRKRLMAIAIESPAMVVIDNVEGPLGSPSLAMALTAGVVRDRLLGTMETVTASLRPVWCVTGNNVQLKGDLGRRVAPIDLDPKVEHPEDRTFARADLLGYVAKERPRLVTAALTVLRGFVTAGKPDHGMTAKGSFEEWDRLVRGAVNWACGSDPLGGVARLRDAADDDLEKIRALLTSWSLTMGQMPMTIADAIRHAETAADLKDALASYCRGGRPDSRTLGYVFRKIAGRVVNNLVMRKSDLNRDYVTKWVVVNVGTSERNNK